mgnify:CR=1 FL=1
MYKEDPSHVINRVCYENAYLNHHLFLLPLRMPKVYALDKILSKNQIKFLNGTSVEMSSEDVRKVIYNDYSNINILLLEEYDMDLSLFYEEFDYPVIHIEEIPNNLLNIIVRKMGIISSNSKLEKSFVFDINMIKEFVEVASNYCVKVISNL